MPTFKVVSLAIFNLGIMTGGWMLAIWVRLFQPWGGALGAEYEAWPWDINLYFIGAIGAANVIAIACQNIPWLARNLTPLRQFRVLILAMILAVITLLIERSELSQLQILYFALATSVLGLSIIVVPGHMRKNAYLQLDISNNLIELYRKRGLMFLWLRYRIEARYAQTVLGILWIVLLPLSTALVLAFAFGELLGRGELPSGVPWVSFLLTAIAIFSIFRDTVLKARQTITGAINIIGRVYFPREILILLLLGEVMIDFLFVFIAMLMINAGQGIYPDIHYLLLPIPVFILACLSTGLAFLVSWLSLIIRDLQQLLTVLMQLMFYIVVLYSPERGSSQYGRIINAIPVTPVITAFRDIILFHRNPNFYSLGYPLVLGMALLYFGYVYFKVNEDRFMDLV